MKFFRKQLAAPLATLGFAIQHQCYDHVLRDDEKLETAFSNLVEYIARNPERKQLVPTDQFREYKFTGALVPGYPELTPWLPDYWERFWRTCSFLRKNGLLRLVEGRTRFVARLPVATFARTWVPTTLNSTPPALASGATGLPMRPLLLLLTMTSAAFAHPGHGSPLRGETGRKATIESPRSGERGYEQKGELLLAQRDSRPRAGKRAAGSPTCRRLRPVCPTQCHPDPLG